MKWTKERTIYAAIGAIALGGLLLDQVILSPQEAEAETADTLTVAATARTTTTAAPETVTAVSRVAKHLEKFAADPQFQKNDVKDAFQPPRWLSGTTHSALPTDAYGFKQAHKLTGVMMDNLGGVASIDKDKVMRVGQVLDGYKLIRIESTKAVFQAQQTIVELELSKVGTR